MDLFVLFESASGYALYSVKHFDELGGIENTVLGDYHAFASSVQLQAFFPFREAAIALANMKSIASGECSSELREFFSMHLPDDYQSFKIGVQDVKLAEGISALGYLVSVTSSVRDLLRACRNHFGKSLKVDRSDLDRARTGLAHAFSRDKIQLDSRKEDKPVINTISILDSLDKSINKFAMRLKEWYGWHFPELTSIIPDNKTYAEVAKVLQKKDLFDWERTEQQLVDACGSLEIAMDIKKAILISSGQDVCDSDIENVVYFSGELLKLTEMKVKLSNYLNLKMDMVAPNLATLMGCPMAARLISHAGSLSTLAKYPASTIQILGAEKALFRALKTKTNTPKYGLLYHSSFIGRAALKNKGRISRYIANKCAMASRIDFHDNIGNCEPSSDLQELEDGSMEIDPRRIYGEKMRQQVEERLEILAARSRGDEVGHIVVKRNDEVMKEAIEYIKEMKLRKSISKKLNTKAVNANSEDLINKTNKQEVVESQKRKSKSKMNSEINPTENSIQRKSGNKKSNGASSDKIESNKNNGKDRDSDQKKAKKSKKMKQDVDETVGTTGCNTIDVVIPTDNVEDKEGRKKDRKKKLNKEFESSVDLTREKRRKSANTPNRESHHTKNRRKTEN